MGLNVLLIAISVVDFIAAFLLYWSFPGDFMVAIAAIVLLKGIYSMTTSMANGFYIDVMGWIDFVAGILLIIINFGTPISFAWIFALLLAGKAGFSIVSSI